MDVNAWSAQAGLPPKSIDEIALGFVQVANEAMCRPIRALTQMKGYDVEKHVLACFGGAGAQHACAIAKSLGISTVFIHRYSGILSAVGIGLADIVKEEQEPCAERFPPPSPTSLASVASTLQRLTRKLEGLQGRAASYLRSLGFTEAQVSCERYLNLRYEGTDVAIMVAEPVDGDYLGAFAEHYQREFGFTLSTRVRTLPVIYSVSTPYCFPHLSLSVCLYRMTCDFIRIYSLKVSPFTPLPSVHLLQPRPFMWTTSVSAAAHPT